jgi:Ca2+:H+ antiporter
MDSVNQAVKQTGLQNIQLGSTLTQEELQRVITAATVSALRHQEAHPRQRSMSAVPDGGDHFAAHGHAAPAWSRTVSASVLLVCTALFATIAGASVSRVYESNSSYIVFSRVAYSRGGLHLEGFGH